MKNKLIIICLLSAFLLQNVTAFSQKRKAKSKSTTKSKPVAKKAKKEQKSKSKKNNKTATVRETPSEVKISTDTLKPSVVNITSSYKPTLKSAAKVNFTATSSVIDTNRFSLGYSIPAQNLFFSYQPVPIKPISLVNDSVLVWQNTKYIKLGYGNFKTPFVEAAFSFGHPNSKVYSINANFVQSTGNIAFQEFTKASIGAQAQINSLRTTSLLGIRYNLANQNRYGINGGLFNAADLDNNFNTIELFGNIQNKVANEKGITYNPTLKLSLFSDNKSGNELNAYVHAPIKKQLNANWNLQLGLLVDVASFSNTLSQKNSTSIVAVQPNVQYKSRAFDVKAGLHPTWSNGTFGLLPNIFVETNVLSDKFSFFAGWNANYLKNSYQTLASTNPFIVQPNTLENTKLSEQFVGFKSSLSKHISFNMQVGLQNYTNMVLFVNDTTTFKTQNFGVLYEPTLSALQIKGEINYTLQDKLSIAIAAKIMQVTKQEVFAKAFGFMPLEISGMARYKLFKDVHLKTDVFFFGGSPYRTKTLQAERLNAALDLNIGAEFAVLNKLNVWLQVNNLLNNRYQRWHQYDVLSLNLVGGVKFMF